MFATKALYTLEFSEAKAIFAKSREKTVQNRLTNIEHLSRDLEGIETGTYERVEAAPSIEFAKRIADAFGESLDYLAGEGILSKLDKKTVKRLQEIESLKEDDKYHFFAIVDAFLRDATARKAYAS